MVSWKVRIPIIGGLGFLALVVGFFSLQTVFVSKPFEDYCEIYRAIIKDVNESNTGHLEVFRPLTYTSQDHDYKSDLLSISEVARRTGEIETIPTSEYGESYASPVIVVSKVDLHNYNWAADHKQRSLKKCFGESNKPNFSRLNLDLIYLQAKIKDKHSDIWPNITSLSEVHYTTNRKYAAVYSVGNCGGLCGWGGIYIFENQSDRCSFVGTSMLWVS